MSESDLIDFAILPQSKLNDYENTITKQSSEITRLESLLQSSKEVPKEDNMNNTPNNTEKDKISDTKLDQTASVTEVEKENEKHNPSQEDSTIEPTIKTVENSENTKSNKVQLGKNFNKTCLARQLGHRLSETGFSMPENIEKLLKAAVGTSKKILPNEKEFYEALRDHNLVSMVNNEHKFKTYLRGSFFEI